MSAAILFAMPPKLVVFEDAEVEGESWPVYPQIANKSAVFPSVVCIPLVRSVAVDEEEKEAVANARASTTLLPGKKGNIGCTWL
jgi:hypothetical protein